MIKKTTLIFILTTLLIRFSYAQTTTVEFRVNMTFFAETERFFPATETVDMAGNFNSWGDDSTPMTDADNDSIYTVLLTLETGSTIEFKCRINGEWNGREEFPGGGPNRVYTVEENDVVTFWYNDEMPDDFLFPDIYTPNIVSGIGEPIHFSDISSGDPVSRIWDFPGGTPSSSADPNPVVVYDQAGSYDVSLTIFGENDEEVSETFHNFIRIDNLETPWWNDRVFYEVFVRSFHDGDGDGIGDFQGLIDKLDYLNDGDPSTTTDLGIGGIWLMPVAQSPSYHGYDATDYRTIEEDYGSNEDFLQFMQEAHARDIKVIVDLVMNHNSSEHPWFLASQDPDDPKRDWYVWSEENPGFNGPWGQQVWHYRNGHYYYGIFWSGMPDLNYENPEVKDEMFDTARYWIEDMNVDGFRLDAVKYIFEDGMQMEDIPPTIEFWKDFRSFYKNVNPDVFAVGEAWTSTDIVSSYVEDGGIDYCFEFDLAYAIMNTVRNGNAAGLQNAVINALTSFPYLQFGTFLTNHDMDRVMSVLQDDEQLAKLASALLLTMPGIPYIYYGEEIGMTGSGAHPNIRTPMQWNSSSNAGFTTGTPWQAVNSDYTFRNVENMQNDPNSLWNHYRTFIQLRNQEPALSRGNYKPVKTNHSNVLAFLRQTDDEHILVMANMGDENREDLLFSSEFADLPQGNYLFTDLINENEQPAGVVLNENGGFTNLAINPLIAKQLRVLKLTEHTGESDQQQPAFTVTVYPNPADDRLKIAINGLPESTLNLRITDTKGRTMLKRDLDHNFRDQIHTIKTEGLEKGAYIIELSNNKNRHVTKMIIE